MRIANNYRYIIPFCMLCIFLLTFTVVVSNFSESGIHLFPAILIAFAGFTSIGMSMIKLVSMRSIDFADEEIQTKSLFGMISETIQLKDIQNIEGDKSFFTFGEMLLSRPRTYVLTYLKNTKNKSFKFYIKGDQASNDALNYFISKVEKAG